MSQIRDNRKYRNRRGGGFFNSVRSLFTRKKVAPAPAPQTVPVVAPLGVTGPPTQKQQQEKKPWYSIFTRKRVAPTPAPVVNPLTNPVKPEDICLKPANVRPFIRDENFMEAYNRSLVFLYYKMKQQPIPARKFLLAQEETNELKFAVQGFEGDFEAMAQTLFHEDIATLNNELADYEQHIPDRILNKGTNYQRCAFDISRSLPRLISLILKSDGMLKYIADYSDNVCNPTMNPMQPVTSLQSKTACVTVATSIEQLENFPEEGRSGSYIIVDPKYFPDSSTVPINLKVNRLLSISFIIDAFKNGGVKAIEPTLLSIIQKEAPELITLKSKRPVVIITPKYMDNAQATSERFMVVDPLSLSRGRNVRNIKNFATDDLIHTLFAKRDVYFLDAETAYDIRSKYTSVWLANFEDPNRSIYDRLKPQEKLAICFLQYVEALRRFSSTKVNNRNNATRRRNLNRAAMAASSVYSEDISSYPAAYALFENFQDKDSYEWNMFKKLQTKVFGTATITSPMDIVTILRKFNRSFLVRKGVGAFEEASTYNKTRRNRTVRVRGMLSRY